MYNSYAVGIVRFASGCYPQALNFAVILYDSIVGRKVVYGSVNKLDTPRLLRETASTWQVVEVLEI